MKTKHITCLHCKVRVPLWVYQAFHQKDGAFVCVPVPCFHCGTAVSEERRTRKVRRIFCSEACRLQRCPGCGILFDRGFCPSCVNGSRATAREVAVIADLLDSYERARTVPTAYERRRALPASP